MNPLDTTHSQELGALFEALANVKNFTDEAYHIKKIINHKFINNDKNSDFLERFFFKIAYGISDCWYWIGCVDQLGYGRINYLEENKSHRVSWKLFYGDIPKNLKVLHKCDVRCCVNPNHLFLGTQLDNIKDMMNKNRNVSSKSLSKEKNPMSKLTQLQVDEIRRIYIKNKNGYIKISRLFGVSPMTIKRIIKNECWVK